MRNGHSKTASFGGKGKEMPFFSNVINTHYRNTVLQPFLIPEYSTKLKETFYLIPNRMSKRVISDNISPEANT